MALLSTESEESVLENDECRFHFLDMNALERDVRFDVNLLLYAVWCESDLICDIVNLVLYTIWREPDSVHDMA